MIQNYSVIQAWRFIMTICPPYILSLRCELKQLAHFPKPLLIESACRFPSPFQSWKSCNSLLEKCHHSTQCIFCCLFKLNKQILSWKCQFLVRLVLRIQTLSFKSVWVLLCCLDGCSTLCVIGCDYLCM